MNLPTSLVRLDVCSRDFKGREGYQSISNKARVDRLAGSNAGRRKTGITRLGKAVKITVRTFILNVDT